MIKNRLTLITGGARSGKSRFALTLAAPYDRRVFIATAQVLDAEMADRIRRHQEERKDRFTTMEEPLDLAGAVRRIPEKTGVAVIDCMTVWLGNLMHHQRIESEDAPSIAAFLDAISRPLCDVVIVTNEVGSGLVPPDAMSRRFRDIAGYLNRKIAHAADEVYLIACGLPLKLK
ncbi:MAG: bifunctional adenosylcobinamide kinase/adenosylcobinamide-phosphate guanylyltransferase [Desulfosalsimonadaceae bacterium]